MWFSNSPFALLPAICSTLLVLHAQEAVQAVDSPADIVRNVLRSLWDYDRNAGTLNREVGFELPESVVNLYLAAALSERPRPMIDGMRLTFLAENRCVVDARVDFTALRAAAPKLFPASKQQEFKGSKSVKAEFHFSVSSGYLTFEAKPLPSEVTPSQPVLSEVIRRIAASQPEKIDTQQKIPLPFRLRRLWTRAGVLCGAT
jgi:hypothetical protein